MQLSKEFLHRLKLNGEPAYRLAWRAGLHPNTLSKFTTGYLRARQGDKRLIHIGELLGLKPDEIFEVGDTEMTT